MKNKKWTLGDIISLIFEILSPILTIAFTCFTPVGKTLDPDIRLSIIGLGITIPIVIIQFSVSSGQNKSEKDIQSLHSSISNLSEKVDHISPVLEQVFLSENERIERFAYRRLGEVYKTILTAVNSRRSGNLRPSEYYQELLYLAEMIIKDKKENKKKFKGEVWAMTSYAEDEWIADEGYEKLWGDQLRETVNMGIPTRRLCLISDELYNIITSDPFKEQPDNKQFKSFVGFLNDYYGKGKNRNSVESYLLRESANPKLAEIKGFFAIKLTNGDLHILYGETVDAEAMTAQVLFDSNEIKDVRKLFEQNAIKNYRIETKLASLVKDNGFMQYLTEQEIKI